MFKTEQYCGDWYNKVKAFFKIYPNSIHYAENTLIWDYIQAETQLNERVMKDLRRFDIPRIRRAIQEIRNEKMPRTISLDFRQKKAKELTGRYKK